MPNTAQSKTVSYVLRHAPEKAGLTLGPGGWVAVDDLLRGLAGMGEPLGLDALKGLVETSNKKRFTLSPDGMLIRAAQGHSVEVDLGLPPKAPPARLFHGTATRFLEVIKAEGLNPISRQHVHLSRNAEIASTVGARHGKPVVLGVAADRMAADGHRFFEADNGVWLTAHVPSHYLIFDERT